jgi:transcriptional regulator with XRE-family HTH domain
MEQPAVQQLFFQHIKSNLPPHLSFVDEIADLLNISHDSVYRRIRGEKPISFEEIQRLSAHFKISLDQFLHLESDSFIFTGKLSDNSRISFEQYLKNVVQNLQYIQGFEQKHLFFLIKDLPWTSFCQVPELGSFKFFVWMKSILYYEELKGKKFSLKNANTEFDALAKKIVRLYNQIPSTEIWNLEGITVTIQQIEYYRESGLFESEEEALIIYQKLEEMVNHIEKQAELGKKFNIGEAISPTAPEFRMFYNELAPGNNTVVADLGKTKITFLNHSVIDFIGTMDERFNNYIYASILNLIHKSTQLSEVGEKERRRFFNGLREKIRVRMKKIE